MKQRFTTRLSGEPGKPTGIEVPPDVMAALGERKNPPVRVSFSGHSYRSTVAVMGGRFMVPVSAAHRESAGVQAGDELSVTLELDLEPRTVELPDDLKAALDRQPGGAAAFEALAPSRRKEFVRQLEEAKTPETRERRLTKIVSGLG